ncbi:MAG: flagellar biosynthesis regulator FlaF [Pikeienuella sp.]
MNAHNRAAAAYGDAKSPRQVEYLAFARITRTLSEASAALEAGGAFEAFARLVAALHENMKLWTFIAAQVANPGNALPQNLRAQLFYLFEFTNAHTKLILSREADTQPLIDVNTAVMRGLRQDHGAQPCPA